MSHAPGQASNVGAAAEDDGITVGESPPFLAELDDLVGQMK
jgi:hypothetical protein